MTDTAREHERRLSARLAAWLDGSLPVDFDPAIADALRGPWEHLAHNANGEQRVRTQELRRIQSAGAAEDRVRLDYRGRYAIELLQNAHDACADAGVVGTA